MKKATDRCVAFFFLCEMRTAGIADALVIVRRPCLLQKLPLIIFFVHCLPSKGNHVKKLCAIVSPVSIKDQT